MKSYKCIILLLLLIGVQTSYAQISNDLGKDEEIAGNFFQNDTNRTLKLSTSDWMIKAAFHLLNAPYVASTLEGNEEEQLVVDLREFDCTTFVENCLALSRTMLRQNPGFELFCRELRSIRYFDGAIDGYASRLHYTTAWITDNVRKNILDDISKALGGNRFPVKVAYMSAHPEKYPALKNNHEQLERIRKMETGINNRSYFYIPRRDIREKQSLIRNGDIVCFTTSIPGLDVSHMGIAYWQKGNLTFIHASSKANKVIVNPQSLADYCILNSSTTGIMVLRPVSYITITDSHYQQK